MQYNHTFERIKKSNYIRIADIVLLLAIIILGIVLLFFLPAKKGDQIEIYVDGKLYGTYGLNQQTTIEIRQDNEFNIIKINYGSLEIIDASCNDKICVDMAKSGFYDKIVCVPNKLVIVFTSSKLDAIT